MSVYVGLDLLDGEGLRVDQTLVVDDGVLTSIAPRQPGDRGIDLGQNGARAWVTPGLIDLQVNGGGGLMLEACQSLDDLHRMTAAHRRGGTRGLLPTLISNTPEVTRRIAALVTEAAKQKPMILGLHLEGPHLSVPGVHDPAHLRPLTPADLEHYLALADRLPHLMITLAPEMADLTQIETLARAGVHVSLGHSSCDYDMAKAAFSVGAEGVTHLFNAMSGLHHRAPGLVGAALDAAQFFGLIADGHHLHPAALRLAAAARPEALCLVSDAMAVAGTEQRQFSLASTPIHRRKGRLTRADGTLAGADLTLAQAVANLHDTTNLPLDRALMAGFDTPHRWLTGQPNGLRPGTSADLLIWDGPHLRGGPL